METEFVLLVAMMFVVIAVLYSSVGHGGASGYIAVMALLSIAPETIRPVALSLNIVVAGFASFRYARAGLVDWQNMLPLVITSVPLAFVGGIVVLPSEIYKPLLGVLLIFSACYLFWQSLGKLEGLNSSDSVVPRYGGAGAGAFIGFLSGLTGIGGGVLLSPLMLLFKWANIRKTAAIASFFILFNSIAGLAGNIVSLNQIPSALPVWAGAVIVGAWIGTSLGLKILPVRYLVWLLTLAIFVSGLKFLLN